MWPFNTTKQTAPKRRRAANMKRAYQAAGIGRLTADWNVQPTSADADIIPNLKLLRARSRDLVQNNDYARRFMWLLKTNVVGHNGILLQNKAKDDNGQLDTQANEKIEAAWADWGRKGNCTMDGAFSWISLQQAVIEAIARDGEALIQIVRAGKYGFSLHILEADLLDADYTDTKKSIKGGVESDVWGRPIAYHLLESYPGDIYGTYNWINRRRVPARDIMHLYLKERAGQTRGVPWMVTPAYRLKMLGGMEEAELVASRISAGKMGFFITPDGESPIADEVEEDTQKYITEAEPGTFETLPEGTDFKAWSPDHPNQAFDPFCKSLLRGIASGLNVSYVALANNLEGVSYSSIRQGELSDRDAWRLLQTWLVENFISPVYEMWLPMALLSDNLNLPARKFDKFNQPYWMPRGWNWVDPQKEINSSILAVRNGFKSLSDVLGEQGHDIEDVFSRLADEKALAEKYGLDLPVLFGEPQNGNNNQTSGSDEETEDSESGTDKSDS